MKSPFKFRRNNMNQYFRKTRKYFWLLLIIGVVFIIFDQVLKSQENKRLAFNREQKIVSSHRTFNESLEIAETVPRCVDHPQPTSLNIENEYWQVLETSNGTIKMFSAFYDQRKFYRRQNLSVVKILSFINQTEPEVKTFCQLRYVGMRDPIVTEVFEYKLMWRAQWGKNTKGFTPFLVTCANPLMTLGFIPISVSLVENKCDFASNQLEVIYRTPEGGKPKPFAVCTKLYEYSDDLSIMVTEWVETLLLLGVNKIFVYVIHVHPNIMKTLRYYESTGIVVIEMMKLPEGLPSRNQSLLQFYHNDLVPLNDCLYKHMYEYSFVAPIDIDEIIVPTGKEDKTWIDLMNRVVEKTSSHQELSSGYVFSNVFFLLDNVKEKELQPEVPNDFVFLQHIYRAVNFSKTGVGSKSFQNTQKVAVVHNHHPMHCLGVDYCDVSYVKKEDAKLQHYRRDCENYPKDECEDFKKNIVEDKTLWQYKDELTANVLESLEKIRNFEYLQFSPSNHATELLQLSTA